MSFIQSVEQRLKLKTGKSQQLSPQHVLTCNFLNEGCEGGWAMFNGYLAESGHLVSEECAPYRGSTNGDQCKLYKKCNPVAKVSNSYFLGISADQVPIDQEVIKKEIFRNGAVVAEFAAPHRFRFYDGGILQEEGPAKSSFVQLETDAQIAT